MSAPVLSWLFLVFLHTACTESRKIVSPLLQSKTLSQPLPCRLCVQKILNPQSQSFSRGYGSILPTSLIYIVLSTRGCTPWRPEAVMSTTRSANKSRHRVFKGRRKRTEYYKKVILFARHVPPSPGKPIPREETCITRKENSSRSSRQRPRFRLCCHSKYPRPGAGILPGFPFDIRHIPKNAPLLTCFHYLLGSTNPWFNTIPMEPFSTSVFKVLI